MGKMYFAKMNINEDIFKVYSGEKNISDLLKKIFKGISSSVQIHDEFGGRYKFFNLDFSEDIMAVTGNLGYIKKGVHSSYDPENDTAIDIVDKNKLEYITFYFDVQHEMLAYLTLPVLGRKKVLQLFSDLIKKSTKDSGNNGIGVEFIQETNLDNLKSELSKFKHLSKMEVKLVPPNGDKEDFADLTSLTVDNIQEGNATQIKQIFQTRSDQGLIMNSKLFKNTVKSIGLGYAEGKFEGLDKNDEKIETNSSKQSPYIKLVPSNSTKSHSIIHEKGRAGIEEIRANKTIIRLEKKESD